MVCLRRVTLSRGLDCLVLAWLATQAKPLGERSHCSLTWRGMQVPPAVLPSPPLPVICSAISQPIGPISSAILAYRLYTTL
jgi:hypothetical protein